MHFISNYSLLSDKKRIFQFIELCEKAELAQLAPQGMPLLMEAGKKLKQVLPDSGPVTADVGAKKHVITKFGELYKNI